MFTKWKGSNMHIRKEEEEERNNQEGIEKNTLSQRNICLYTERANQAKINVVYSPQLQISLKFMVFKDN